MPSVRLTMGSVHYSEYGQGVPLVLLHASPGSGDSTRDLFVEYSRGLTISSSELDSFAVRIGRRFTPGSWQSSLFHSFLGRAERSKTTPCKALLSSERASCIENSAAFSFDERQLLNQR